MVSLGFFNIDFKGEKIRIYTDLASGAACY